MGTIYDTGLYGLLFQQNISNAVHVFKDKNLIKESFTRVAPRADKAVS